MTGIEVGVAVIIGVLLGRFLPNRRKGPKPAKAPEPVCGCEHHHSYHDPASGKCSAAVEVPSQYDHCGSVVAYKQAACGCRQYSGALPLPEYYVPEISDK